VKPEYLVRGLPGHPLHPPFTDVTVGAYVVAAVAAVGDATGAVDRNAAIAWWIALVVALIAAALTAATGLIDWLQISRGTPLWRTATLHGLVNVAAGALFLVAAIIGHKGYTHGNVTTGPFVLTILGLAVLIVGGWLGGTIVFVHGMRVLNLVDEPTRRAATPYPHPEKEEAAR
jgi:uncharacterized membrane protein